MMFGPLLLVAAAATPTSTPQNTALACVISETDRLASDPKQVAELRRWTRWEATRLLWSTAGDSPNCAAAFKQTRLTIENSNAAYRHADRLVVSKHLHRD
jgi:hypothetical protein